MAKNKHTENLPKPETDKSDKDKIKHCDPSDINSHSLKMTYYFAYCQCYSSPCKIV